MKLEVNGIRYENFKEASVTLRLDALSNTFSFSAVSTKADLLPFKEGDRCRVIVDGEAVTNGYIEIISISGDSTTHEINIQGRDKTADLVDSSIDQISDIRSPVTLKAVIEKVLKSLSLNISVTDNANSPKFNAAEYIAAPDPGDNAFEFVEKLARLRQVILTSDSDGNIVIEKTSGKDSGAKLQHIVNSNNNNVMSFSASYDRTGRYNVYKFVSSLNPVTLNNAGKTDTASIVNQNGAVVDTEVRSGRQLVFVTELSIGGDQDKARAEWEAKIRKARGRVYSCVVSGYRPDDDSDLWTPNTLVTVVDDFAKINTKMLINTVTYEFNQSSGRTTNITLVEKSAYNLAVSEPKSQELGF